MRLGPRGYALDSFAMDLKVVGNQLILSAPVVDGDLSKIQARFTRAAATSIVGAARLVLGCLAIDLM